MVWSVDSRGVAHCKSRRVSVVVNCIAEAKGIKRGPIDTDMVARGGRNGIALDR